MKTAESTKGLFITKDNNIQQACETREQCILQWSLNFFMFKCTYVDDDFVIYIFWRAYKQNKYFDTDLWIFLVS